MVYLLVNVLQGNRTNKVCEQGTGSDFKELAHVIVGPGKAKIWRLGWYQKTQGKADVAVCVPRLSAGLIPFPRGPQSFFFSYDWMSPTHFMEGNLPTPILLI